MRDGSIHTRAIARQFQPGDFIDHPELLDHAVRQDVISEAVEIGKNGFDQPQMKQSTLRGKSVLQFENFAELLVSRHISTNIRAITGAKQDDRRFIIDCLVSLLSEGLPFKVYKLDIRQFYESSHPTELVDELRRHEGFSGQSCSALQSLFSELSQMGIPGLPRGLGLSAILAEYSMRNFDEFVFNQEEVWFFARFVDDIIIISSGREDKTNFIKGLEAHLPAGLEFNQQKQKVLDFSPFNKNRTGTEAAFPFLGYEFRIDHIKREDGQLRRDVNLDIAPSKVKKLKTRIVRSLIDFRSNGDFEMLHDRIKLLTSNFNYVDRKAGVRRVSGIYFNYPGIDNQKSTALLELDRFLRNALMSPHKKNKWRPQLTKAQRKLLVQLSFSSGFRDRRFFSFSPERLATLVACWRYA